MRAWYVEGLDATVTTEIVPGNSGIELVGGQVVFTLKKSKFGFSDDQMLETDFEAHATITLTQTEVFICVHLELNLAAVTAAFMRCYRHLCPRYCPSLPKQQAYYSQALHTVSRVRVGS